MHFILHHAETIHHRLERGDYEMKERRYEGKQCCAQTAACELKNGLKILFVRV